MKKNEVIKYQYRYAKKTDDLIIVHVNWNNRKSWYEAYSNLDCMHFDTDKEYLLNETIPLDANNFSDITKSLLKQGIISESYELVNRLPKLKKVK